MSLHIRRCVHPFRRALLAALAAGAGWAAEPSTLDGRFTAAVRPFLNTYCVTCHSARQPAAQLDLSGFTSRAALVQDGGGGARSSNGSKHGRCPPPEHGNPRPGSGSRR